jgi:hypothetical protein
MFLIKNSTIFQNWSPAARHRTVLTEGVRLKKLRWSQLSVSSKNAHNAFTMKIWNDTINQNMKNKFEDLHCDQKAIWNESLQNCGK